MFNADITYFFPCAVMLFEQKVTLHGNKSNFMNYEKGDT